MSAKKNKTNVTKKVCSCSKILKSIKLQWTLSHCHSVKFSQENLPPNPWWRAERRPGQPASCRSLQGSAKQPLLMLKARLQKSEKKENSWNDKECRWWSSGKTDRPEYWNPEAISVKAATVTKYCLKVPVKPLTHIDPVDSSSTL